MKRRDFIINSALAIGGTALLAGCGEKKLIFQYQLRHPAVIL